MGVGSIFISDMVTSERGWSSNFKVLVYCICLSGDPLICEVASPLMIFVAILCTCRNIRNMFDFVQRLNFCQDRIQSFLNPHDPQLLLLCIPVYNQEESRAALP